MNNKIFIISFLFAAIVLPVAVNAQAYWPNYNNNNYNGPITFSQNNTSVGLGQSTTVTIYGGYGNGYYLATASSLVGTGINGNILSIYGNANGNAVLTICAYNSNSCGNLYVNVYGNYYPNNYYTNYYPNNYYPNYYPNYQYSNYNYQSPIYLGQSNIYMSSGQNYSVNISGGGNYRVSSISNPNIVSATINGNMLNVYAFNQGSTNITVCQNYGSCANLYVNVSGNYNNNYHPIPMRRIPRYRY